MSGDGESKKPKSDVLASIRRIMRGGSADLGEVPKPGSQAGEDQTAGADSGEADDDWALPPGALSDAERDALQGGEGAGAEDTAGPAEAPEDDDDDDDDDILTLGPAMQVSQPAPEIEDEPADDAADEYALGAGAVSDPVADLADDTVAEPAADPITDPIADPVADPVIAEDDPLVPEEPFGAEPRPEWESEPETADRELAAVVEDAPAADDGPAGGQDADAVSADDRWDWPGDAAAPEAASDAIADAPETAAAAALAEDPSGADSLDAEPALTLGEIEDTVRRVVREELEGETGNRLSQNIRRLVLNEIARAMQRTD